MAGGQTDRLTDRFGFFSPSHNPSLLSVLSQPNLPPTGVCRPLRPAVSQVQERPDPIWEDGPDAPAVPVTPFLCPPGTYSLGCAPRLGPLWEPFPRRGLLSPICLRLPEAGMRTPAEQGWPAEGSPVPVSPGVFSHQIGKGLSSPGWSSAAPTFLRVGAGRCSIPPLTPTEASAGKNSGNVPSHELAPASLGSPDDLGTTWVLLHLSPYPLEPSAYTGPHSCLRNKDLENPVLLPTPPNPAPPGSHPAPAHIGPAAVSLSPPPFPMCVGCTRTHTHVHA